MKLKSIIFIIILAGASFYIYQDKALRTQFLGMFHQVAPELNKSTLYKWKNKKGEWQITDKPPAKGIPYTTVSSSDQVNVLSDKPAKDK